MFINPKEAIENGWVTNIKNIEKQVQPNAIDFTLDKLFGFDQNEIFKIIDVDGKEIKQMRKTNEIQVGDEGYWELQPKTTYDGMSNMQVKIVEGVAAILFVRSTFNRNGIFITSGLYDSGFENYLGFHIHNNSHMLSMVGQNVRIGQIAFIESENSHLYNGTYNRNHGEHWSSIAIS